MRVENLHCQAVDVHGFSAQKLDWHLPKLGRMCYIPEKIARKILKECIGVASVITFACSDFAGPDLRSILVEGYVR